MEIQEVLQLNIIFLLLTSDAESVPPITSLLFLKKPVAIPALPCAFLRCIISKAFRDILGAYSCSPVFSNAVGAQKTLSADNNGFLLQTTRARTKLMELQD